MMPPPEKKQKNRTGRLISTLITTVLFIAVVHKSDAATRACVDVRADFGAKGDGVTDDTQAIQNAMTYAEQTASTVNIPPGVYLIGPVTMGDPATVANYFPSGQVRAVGAVIGSGGMRTTFKAKPGAFTSGQAVLSRRNSIAITIRGIHIDGQNVAPGGLDISFDKTKITVGSDPTSWNFINDIVVENCTEYGVNLDRVYDSKIGSIYVRRVPNGAVAFSLQGPGGMIHADNVYIFAGKTLLASQNSGFVQCGFFTGVELTGGSYNMMAFVGCHFFPNPVTGVTVLSSTATRSLRFEGCFFGKTSVLFKGKYCLGASFNSCHFNEVPNIAFFSDIEPVAANKRPVFAFEQCTFSSLNPSSTSVAVCRVRLEDCLVGSSIIDSKNY